MLIRIAVILVLTLLAYCLGVRSISGSKKLKPLQLLLLWLAFCGNAAGSGLLKLAVGERSGFAEGLRGTCIIIAMVILFIHAVWATALMVIPDDKNKRIFLRDSKLVWKIWIVFFILGVAPAFIG